MHRLLLRKAAGCAHAAVIVVMSAFATEVCIADAPPRVTAADYARAERFLSWNRNRYVLNADIQHHWIDGQDRFWYLRSGAVGETEFVVVDAATGKESPAFDHRRIAGALSAGTGRRIDAAHLPFSVFRYVNNQTAILFHWDDKAWTCHLAAASCVAASAAHASSEVRSPDGQWAAFLKDHDLWIRPLAGGADFPLTSDGVEHFSYASLPGYSTHAVTDIRRARPAPPQVLWSPDSRYVFTYRLDERQVKDLFLLQSVPEDGTFRPKLYTYRYAMPGDEHLPVTELLVFDVLARHKVSAAAAPLICPPQTLIEKRGAWWSSDSRRIYYLNRDRYSKAIALHRFDPVTGAVTRVVRDTTDTMIQTNANNVFDFPLVRTLRNGDVIWYSQRDGWGHLYYYADNGVLRNRVTKGDWVVRDVVRVDEGTKTVYFTASGRELGRDPYEQRLYRVQFDGSGLRLLTPEPADHGRLRPFPKSSGSELPPAEAETQQFAPSGRYFVDSYSRPDMPPVMVLRASDGRLIRQLEQADISPLREGGYVPIEPFQVVAADGKTAIYGNLFRPSTFDPTRKYPVIDATHPGPQVIRTAKTFMAATFDIFEAQSLAELGFIVVTIDGRGTPNRSKSFLDHSYGRLNRASDLEDHIAGLRQLARRYPYLDLTSVGIDGASAGGYLASRAILMYPDFYRVAVSAEGNHDLRGYLAPWGESYNGPLEQGSYSAYSTLSLAPNLKGKLFLMHGELDDNVSPTLTMKLVDALIKANKDFDLLILPNANHGAFLSSPYFIRRKWDYFVRHLLRADPPADYTIEQPG